MRIAGTPSERDEHGLSIADPRVAAMVGSTSEGAIELTFHFQDRTDRSLSAKVSLEIDPAEAIDLIDKMISELAALGVTIHPYGVQAKA